MATAREQREPEEYFLPAIDAMETKDELVIIADMPGVAPGDLEVSVEGDVLTVRGRVQPTAVESLEALHQEFLRGDYFRQFRMPRDFQPDKVQAGLKAGVVTVRIPRQERAKPHRIAIRAE